MPGCLGGQRTNVKVVILCGGFGMRLREETELRPKPMVEVGGRPILWHIMKTFAHYGYNEFVLCLGYKSEVIKNYFLNYEFLNNDFTIELGSHKLGTGGTTVHNQHGEMVDFSAHRADSKAVVVFYRSVVW